jgi:hypothetical protein
VTPPMFNGARVPPMESGSKCTCISTAFGIRNAIQFPLCALLSSEPGDVHAAPLGAILHAHPRKAGYTDRPIAMHLQSGLRSPVALPRQTRLSGSACALKETEPQVAAGQRQRRPAWIVAPEGPGSDVAAQVLDR